MLELLGFIYGIAKNLGNFLTFKEETKLVDTNWLEKSGLTAKAQQEGFELRWSNPEKVESRRFEGWDIWYEVDKLRRIRRRIVLKGGAVLIARSETTRPK